MKVENQNNMIYITPSAIPSSSGESVQSDYQPCEENCARNHTHKTFTCEVCKEPYFWGFR